MIKFEEKSHKYTNVVTEEEYISVTTLIGTYKPEFDSDYWSTYKAVKWVLESKNEWVDYKRNCGGWENVVDWWNVMDPVYFEEVMDVKVKYLDKWEKKKKDACDKGTKIHKQLEDEVNKKHGIVKGEGKPFFELQDFESDGVYTELLVYNHKYRLAGQVDKVEKNGRKLRIGDYKTNKKIEKQAFRNETMVGPLSCFPNANYYHYLCQMSIYGWILEQFGYEIESLTLEHIGFKNYSIEYRPDIVELLLKDYVEF